MASPARLAIVGAGVAGCTLAARLCALGWAAESIHLWETGRGPGGRTATRRSRHDRMLRIDHGASFFNIGFEPTPSVLQPLLQQGSVEPWKEPIARLNGAAELVPPDPTDPLLRGHWFRGKDGMENLCGGLLQLAGDHLQPRFNTLVRDLAWSQDRWLLKDNDGATLDESRALVLTGTLLAHPRSRLTFGWPTPPLQLLAQDVQDPGLNHALAAISALRFEARSALLLRLPAPTAALWLEVPFRLLLFDASAQQRWGLWRISIQPLPDGSAAVVAHSSATFAAEHLGIYGSRSAIARQLGLIASPAEEQRVIQALEVSLQEVMGPWGVPPCSELAEKQLMRWGAAFPLQPGLPLELSWNPGLKLGFCGDYLAGPGFGRVEGAMRSAEELAERLVCQGV